MNRLKELDVKVNEVTKKVCSFLGWECTINGKYYK